MTKIPTNNTEKAIWFNKIIDPSNKCRNLRAFCKNIFGCKLEKNQYWALRDMLDPKIRLIYYTSSRQCLSGNSLVIPKNGQVLPIKDIKEAWNTGKKEVYLIKTKKGKQLECTLNHKFMTKEGWKTLQEVLNKELLIEVPDYLPYPDNVKCNINDNRLKILGYLLSDGYGYITRGQSIKFTNITPLYLKEFEELVNTEFPTIKTKWYRKGNGYDILCTAGKKTYRTNELQAWINSLTFVGNFPIELMACNKSQAVCFISRLYAGDGYAWAGKRNQELGIGTSRKYVIKYLQLLLQKFNIHSYYNKEGNMLRLRISNSTSIINFFNMCKIFGKEKACLKLENKAKSIKSNKVYENTNFDKIKSSKYIGIKDTYDMEVLPEHYYYANGIKVHNSGKTHTIGLFQSIAALFPEFVILGYERNGNSYIFAPKKEQAEISFNRFTNFVHFNDYNIYSDSIIADKFDTIAFRNGFEVRAITASRNAEIEGLTTQIIILDEAGNISPYKVNDCLTGDTIIPLANGKYATLKEVVNNKLPVLTPEGEEMPSKHIEHGEDTIYEITLANGKILKCNDRHKHLVYHKNWRNLKIGAIKKLNTSKLKKGHRLAMANSLPYFGKTGDYKDGFIVGSFLGDGCLTQTPQFTGYRKEVDYLTNMLKTKYTLNCRIAKKKATQKVFSAHYHAKHNTGLLNTNPLTKYFRNLGMFNKTGENKEIPNQAWSKEFLKGLIISLIETDGCIHESNKRNGFICFDNISEKMVKQLQNYLQKFGIHSRVSVKENNGNFGYKTKPIWTITIKAVADIIKFYNTFTLVTKQEKLEKLYNQRKTHKERNHSKHYPNNMRFSRIVDIKKLEKKEKVYCVQVSGKHEWIVNGLISLNSILPMGSGVEGGAKIIQCGVPSVLGSHFHKAYRNKYDKETNPLGYVHHVYTWQNCPRLNLAYIMNLKKQDPDSFERNYELKWERSNHGYFTTYEEYEACEEDYDPHAMLKKAIKNNWAMYWGIDFAKLRDSTVLITLAQNPENKHFYIVGNIIELRGTDYIDQIGYFKNIYIPGHIKHTCADKSSVGEMPVETLNDGGILTTGISFNSQSKDKMFKILRYQIQNKLIHWPKTLPNKEYRRFKQQLLELEIEHKTTGLISVHHNLDDNLARDDFPDALCLAVYAGTEYIEPNVSFV